jgi:hypothetical protein
MIEILTNTLLYKSIILLNFFRKNCEREQQGGIGCKQYMQCFDLYCDDDQV